MEEYIHGDVLRLFARSFITGFVNLMLELGFDPNLQGIQHPTAKQKLILTHFSS